MRNPQQFTYDKYGFLWLLDADPPVVANLFGISSPPLSFIPSSHPLGLALFSLLSNNNDVLLVNGPIPVAPLLTFTNPGNNTVNVALQAATLHPVTLYISSSLPLLFPLPPL